MFNYYPPSLYYLGAVLKISGFQIIDTVKLLFILGFIASGVTMFFLLRDFFGLLPAYTGSLLYVYAPFRAVEVYVRGALSESWALALFPLLFLYSFRAVKNGQRSNYLFLAIVISLLLLTHIPMSVIFLPVLAVWIFALAIFFREFKRLPKFVASFILAVGMAAFFIIPAIVEKGYVHTETLIGGYFDYRQHFVSLGGLFFSNRWGYGSSNLGQTDNLSLSVGIVHWIAALGALVLALFSIKRNVFIAKLAILLVGLALGILFMVHQKSSFIWETINFLAYLQFPWRFLGPAIFLLSFLAAVGIFLCPRGKFTLFATLFLLLAAWSLYGNFFKPKDWLRITDKEKLSGVIWEKQLTSSIFDYLPIYAQFPPTTKAPDYPEVLSGEAVIESYNKGSDFQEGVILVKSAVKLRVPLYDFPGMSVYVDDSFVQHLNNDCSGLPFCLGLINFSIPNEGRHTIKIKLENTPLRTFANIFTLLSFSSVIPILAVLMASEVKSSRGYAKSV